MSASGRKPLFTVTEVEVPLSARKRSFIRCEFQFFEGRLPANSGSWLTCTPDNRCRPKPAFRKMYRRRIPVLSSRMIVRPRYSLNMFKSVSSNVMTRDAFRNMMSETTVQREISRSIMRTRTLFSKSTCWAVTGVAPAAWMGWPVASVFLNKRRLAAGDHEPARHLSGQVV